MLGHRPGLVAQQALGVSQAGDFLHIGGTLGTNVTELEVGHTGGEPCLGETPVQRSVAETLPSLILHQVQGTNGTWR
ncbi:hypothetical protein D3C78_1670420 [compost metagenome]